jgi:hypothetical protein
MIPRIRWVSFAVMALLTIAPACLAAEGETGYKPGRGGVGGGIGSSYFGFDRMVGSEWFGDYSKGALPRFSFAAQFRYVHSPHWRWQVSPGLTWTAYKTGTRIPFVDLRNPTDDSKDQMLTILVPVTAQVQYVVHKGRWYYHLGAGPGLYRVMVENHRKVLKDPDPTSLQLHRNVFFGGALELGAERFLKAINSTSIELSWTNHLVFAQKDQFLSGFDSNLMAMEFRVGVNYYFDPLKQKTPGIPVPDIPSTPAQPPK